MFFNIVGQGFTLGYCGRKMAQLSSTCFFVLQFYRILLLISVNGKNDKFVFNLVKENKIAQIKFFSTYAWKILNNLSIPLNSYHELSFCESNLPLPLAYSSIIQSLSLF